MHTDSHGSGLKNPAFSMLTAARWRPLGAMLLGVGLLVGSAPAQARVATAFCRTEISTHSWHPLPLETIARVVEARVLQKLTAGGQLTLLPRGKPPTGADVQVRVIARIIEDAGEFSVFVSVEPRAQKRVGSLAAVATNSLRGKDHKRIQQQMERTADQAAAKVGKLLGSRLALLTGGDDGALPPPPTGDIAFDWGKRLQGRHRAQRNLDVGALTAERDTKARIKLADCALAHKQSRGERLQCVQALIQLAKTHPFAQRALLKVLVEPGSNTRHNYSSDARREAYRISTTFRGPALEEAKQAWLQVLAADHSQLFGSSREDYFLLDHIGDYFARHPSVPNLDLALASCSQPSTRGHSPSGACLKVLSTLPPVRRLSLLYPFLVPEPKNWDRVTTWRGILENALKGVDTMHPELAKLCMKKIQQSRYDRVRSACAKALARHQAPSEKLATFFIDELLTGSLTEKDVDDATELMPRLCPALKRALDKDHSPGKAAVARRLSPSFLHRCRK